MAASDRNSPLKRSSPVNWQLESRCLDPRISGVRSWLLDDGSLTQHLVDTGRRFSVERRRQQWERPTLDECQRLEIASREKALIREVLLRLDGEAVVFARSVFPESTLSGPLLRLRRLANQSLGAFLFARRDMRRSPFEIARLHADHNYVPDEVLGDATVWARRSCFRIAERSILVAEAFLPGFPSWQAPMPVHRSRRGRVSATIGG